MTKKVFHLLLLLASFRCSAQNQGSIKYRIVEKVSEHKTNKVNGLLEFNDTSSLFSYYKVSLEDSVELNRSLIDTSAGAIFIVSPFDEKGRQVYRDYKNKIILQRQPKAKPLEALLIKDEWIAFKWIETNKTRKILNYTCYKATTSFRGRNYTAWFTKAIPEQYGPWKFFGLPGMILEAYDDAKIFRFSAIKVTIPDSTSHGPITPPMEATTMTIREYAHFMDFYMENVESAFRKLLPKGKGITITLSDKDRTTPEKIKKERKFRMEKQYEWESEEKNEVYLNKN